VIKKNKKLFAYILLTAILIIVARALRLMINDMESLILPTLLIYLRGVIHLSLALVWTVSGDVLVHTERMDGNFVLSVTVPANTRATVILPNGENKCVGNGKYIFKCEI